MDPLWEPCAGALACAGPNIFSGQWARDSEGAKLPPRSSLSVRVVSPVAAIANESPSLPLSRCRWDSPSKPGFAAQATVGVSTELLIEEPTPLFRSQSSYSLSLCCGPATLEFSLSRIGIRIVCASVVAATTAATITAAAAAAAAVWGFKAVKI